MNLDVLTADVLLECIINEPTELISSLMHSEEKQEPASDPQWETEGLEEDWEVDEDQWTEGEEIAEPDGGEGKTMSALIAETKALQRALNARILGQAHARGDCLCRHARRAGTGARRHVRHTLCG